MLPLSAHEQTCVWRSTLQTCVLSRQLTDERQLECLISISYDAHENRDPKKSKHEHEPQRKHDERERSEHGEHKAQNHHHHPQRDGRAEKEQTLQGMELDEFVLFVGLGH